MMDTKLNAVISYDGEFIGACMEKVAQRSVCGPAQARAYARENAQALSFGTPINDIKVWTTDSS